MTQTKGLQLGDLGIPLEAEIFTDGKPWDGSAATSVQFFLEAPDGTVKTRTGHKSTTGQDGRFMYVLAAGDLDQIGDWRWQARIVTPSVERRTRRFLLRVSSNLA